MGRSKRRSSQKDYNPQELIMLHPKTDAQKRMIESMNSKPITIAYGDSGTGKTLMALANAVWKLQRGEINKIIYIKPYETVGKELGALPGDLDEKLDPLKGAVMDNLTVFCSKGKADILVRKKDIEIYPLAFIRGRSIRDTFVILDEAQNCSSVELKTTISRLGEGSQIVITGDSDQKDTKHFTDDGLSDAVYRLKNLRSVGLIGFTEDDVLRNDWLSALLKRYKN